MGISFYPVPTEVILDDDKERWRFWGLIIKKEYKSRLSGLDIGEFPLTINEVETELDISQKKVRNLIKKEIDKGLLLIVSKSKSKKDKSIYKMLYLTQLYQGHSTGHSCDTTKGTVESSNTNALTMVKGTVGAQLGAQLGHGCTSEHIENTEVEGSLLNNYYKNIIYNELDKSNSSSMSTKKTNQETSNSKAYKQIQEAWNSIDAVTKIKQIKAGSKRAKMLNGRISEFGMEGVLEAMENVSKSSFLKESVFFNFDWFVRPNNFIKILEGNYNEREVKANGSAERGDPKTNENAKTEGSKDYSYLYDNHRYK